MVLTVQSLQTVLGSLSDSEKGALADVISKTEKRAKKLLRESGLYSEITFEQKSILHHLQDLLCVLREDSVGQEASPGQREQLMALRALKGPSRVDKVVSELRESTKVFSNAQINLNRRNSRAAVAPSQHTESRDA